MFDFAKTFDLNEIMDTLLAAPKDGSQSADVVLNEFVAMTYDPPPAYFGLMPITQDRELALELFEADLKAEPPTTALDICIDAIANRIAAGERFIHGAG